ncbi:MAG: siroheme synthase CysG [Pseudomonadales bacterium]|nr:siroheme synthase CysG [Pseudomonadales bacterium]
MDYLPLFFKLQTQHCLLVGGGQVAYRKAELLLAAGASLTVVAPDICEPLLALIAKHRSTKYLRRFQLQDLNKTSLVVCATDDEAVNANVASLAGERCLPVNVVDNAALSTVIFPAIIDRSPVIIAASTGGKSPVLTRKIREMLEALIPANYGNLATFLGDKRLQLKQRFPIANERRKIVEAFLTSPGKSFAEAGDYQAADEYLIPESVAQLSAGEVYLVGAGPGDPDLLTLRALQLMQQADVVLYDNLVSDAVLSRVRRDSVKEYVGKIGRAEFTCQETINDKLVRLAKAGHRVLRLKGGDPFIFGRGGEELESLVAESIPFQVVPGITSASGCSAYAGIPLTHRDYSQSVRFVTGHPKQGQVDLAWREFAHKNQTIVFYMGLGGLKEICRQLIAHGRAPSTPIALVSKGTTPDQKTVVGDLETIVSIVEKEHIARPTLIIVGEVVALRATLSP